MKIAIICGRIPSPTFIENLIIGLANRGIRVQLIGKIIGNISYNNNFIKNYGTGGRLKNFFLFQKYLILLSIFKISYLYNLYNQSRNKDKSFYQSIIKYGPLLLDKPDIIHIQWAKEIEDWIWLKTFDIKIVLSLRGTHINTSPLSDEDLSEKYIKYFPDISKFHCVSDAIMKIAKKYCLQPINALTIYSGVDLNRIKNLKLKHVDNNNLKILSVGRDHWKKGYNYSILAVSHLKKEGIDFQYEIIAKESEENQFLINQLELKNQVMFKGNLDHDDVLKEMGSSDILILPSVEEGIANVVLEAMAIGLPVISTNCGGMSEVIKNGENGFLIDYRNPIQIFNAIKVYMTLTESEKSRILINARRTIETQHNLDNSIDKFSELYSNTLKKDLIQNN